MKSLYKYQQNDVDFLSKFNSCANFSEPRTGKTLVAIGTYKKWCLKQPAPLLVICPASIVSHWKNELQTQLPNYAIYLKKDMLNSKPKFIDSNFAIVVSYDFIRTYKDKISKLSHVIIDEAHMIKNSSALVSKAILSKDFNALILNKMVLTATPALNAPIEVFNLLKFLYPKTYTSKYKFGDEWCNSKSNPFATWKGAKEFTSIKYYKKEEFINLLSKFSVQRRRIDVEQFMPNIREEDIFIDPSNECINFERKLRNTFGTVKFPNGVIESIFKEQGYSAQAFQIWRKLYEWGDYYYGVENAKTVWIENFIEGLIEAGIFTDKILIYSESKVYVKLLANLLSNKFKSLNIASLSGDDNDKIADERKANFQLGKIDVMCVSRAKCYQGVDLSKASIMIFVDIPANPGTLTQTINRITPPISASTSVKLSKKFIYYLHNNNAIGKWMSDLVKNKDAQLNFINDWSMLVKDWNWLEK